MLYFNEDQLISTSTMNDECTTCASAAYERIAHTSIVQLTQVLIQSRRRIVEVALLSVVRCIPEILPTVSTSTQAIQKPGNQRDASTISNRYSALVRTSHPSLLTQLVSKNCDILHQFSFIISGTRITIPYSKQILVKKIIVIMTLVLVQGALKMSLHPALLTSLHTSLPPGGDILFTHLSHHPHCFLMLISYSKIPWRLVHEVLTDQHSKARYHCQQDLYPPALYCLLQSLQ